MFVRVAWLTKYTRPAGEVFCSMEFEGNGFGSAAVVVEFEVGEGVAFVPEVCMGIKTALGGSCCCSLRAGR